MTQRELGELCGLDQTAINRMESPGYNPTWRQIMRMLAALKITPGEFFGSVIPLAFSEPLHAELHEKLQDILESATEAVGGIKVNIEWIHSELVRRKAKPVRKTERPPSRKELARHMMGS